VDEVLGEVRRLAGEGPEAVRHTVITGGEPMLFAELIPLCAGLRAGSQHITIETAGTLHLPVQCDLMSISPKLASSTPSADLAGKWSQRHELSRHVPAVIRRLTSEYDYQLKFVIDTPADCREVLAFLELFPDIRGERVLLMPQGTSQAELTAKGEWLAPYAAAQGFAYCPRMQIEWYGAKRGT
jgi:7-carboxy-7-deazaguanine synthase